MGAYHSLPHIEARITHFLFSLAPKKKKKKERKENRN